MSYPSDWEYYSDEYWEQGPSKKLKRSPDHEKCAEIANHTKRTKKKRRSPEISNDEPNLAASSVVWRSKEQASKTHDGPVIEEGQLETVSLLKDWKERFKATTQFAPKLKGLRTSQTEEPRSTNKALLEVSESALSLPPMTLEEIEDTLSLSRLPAEAVFELPSNDNEAFCLHRYDEIPDTTDGACLPPISGLHGKRTANGDYHTTDDGEILPSPTNAIKRPNKRKGDALIDDPSGDYHQQTVEALPSPVKKRRLARPTKQTQFDTVDEADSKINPKSSIETPIPEREGEASGPLLKQTKKRGRPKKQKTIDADTDKISEIPAQVIEPKRKRGRPKKQHS